MCCIYSDLNFGVTFFGSDFLLYGGIIFPVREHLLLQISLSKLVTQLTASAYLSVLISFTSHPNHLMN